MKNLAGKPGCRVESVNHIALANILRIAFRREHYAQRRALVPLRLDAVETLVERSVAQFHEIALEAHQDWLGFRVPEATVVFEYVWRPVGVHHDAGIKEAGIGRTVFCEAPDAGFDDLAHDPLVHGPGDHRC